VEIKQSVKNLLEGCVAVKKSAKFRNLLEVVLAFGNFLNYNSNRGGCWGFKLKDLARLSDVKSASDSHMTMLHFLIEYMDAAYSTQIDFYNDLQCLEEVCHLQQLSFLHEELSELNNGIKMIEDFTASAASNYGPFRDIMTKFVPASKQLVQKIDELLEKGEKMFQEMVIFFGEAPGTTLDEFFGEIWRFCNTFEKTRAEIHRKREQEELQKARQEQMARHKQQQQQMRKPVGRLERALADLSSGSYANKQQMNQNQNTNREIRPDKSTDTDNTSLAAVAAPQQQNKTGSDTNSIVTPRNRIMVSARQTNTAVSSRPTNPTNPTANPTSPTSPTSTSRTTNTVVKTAGTPRTPRTAATTANPVQKEKLEEALAYLKK
jgi:hypothetical protein